MFDLQRDFPELARNSILAGDIERFSRLADGYVIADAARSRVLVDVRYSMLPTSTRPMWGIDLNAASASEHARFEIYRDRPENYRELFVKMLLGRDIPQ